MRRRTRKVKGPKRVPYELIASDSVVGRPIYRLCSDLMRDYHEEIEDSRVALAWNLAWKPDVDGHVTLGKCKLASDLDRELAAFDFVILLRKHWWTDPTTTDLQRQALLDHELCHATVRVDAHTGEAVRDERGRKVYRMRKHDLEEFTDVIRRHGVWKADLETMAKALLRSVGDFTPCDQCRDSPGWVALEGLVTRCECWHTWRERATAARELRA